MNATAKPHSVREDFPALAELDASDDFRKLAYLDNAATTQRLGYAIDAATQINAQMAANPYRGTYQESREVTRTYETARVDVARFIGARPDEVVFTRNATEALNLVAASWGCANLKKGDVIALPVSEHHSNLVVWQRVADRTGARMKYIHLDQNGRLLEDEVDAALSANCKLLAIAHVSNVLGTVFPLAELAQRAHAVGAVIVADCAQSAGHRCLDMKELDVDFAAFSGHKTYAPDGIGVLFAKHELLESMEPFLLGGEMVDEVWDRHTSYKPGPRRFEAGTPNVSGAVALSVACRYLSSIGMETIERVELQLAKRLLEGLNQIDSVRIYGNPSPGPNRVPIVAFNVEGVDPRDAALAYNRAGIALRIGTHCAQPLHRRLGVEMSCRVSPTFYNSPEEIDRFLEATESLRRTVCETVVSHLP